jgi:uncharacterized protein (UPF0332 family)
MRGMTAGDRRVLSRFAERVRALSPDARISAFGSRARGTAHPESDFDLCVVLPAVTPEAREAIYAIAWEIGFAAGCVLAPIVLSQEDFESGPLSASTLVRTIRREGIAALIRYRLEQADEALAAAALNLANGLERSAINRAYYAMFYAVLALLAERTIETSRHSGAVAQFDLLFVKPQVFRSDLSRSLHRAFLHRQAADYGAEVTLTRGEIEALTSDARTFVAEIRAYFERPAPGAAGGDGTR